MRTLLFVFVLGSIAVSHAAGVDPAKLPPAASRPVDFTRDVQPIFEASCWNCHGPKKSESGFRLDDRAAALKGGDRGNDIVPGQSAASLLIHAVSGLDEELKMPRKGEALTADQVGILRAWIDQGATMPDKIASEKDPARHWAFKAPVKPNVPASATNPIDAFVRARLEKENLKPSPEADKITQLRRLHLDLTGLPPKPAEVDAFLADRSKEAYANAVEKLLASPHYGERWGRHWLDAARYADSDGYEKDMSREMWPYRARCGPTATTS
jgi:mono/diheme cytochrome c family protein